MNRMTDSDMIHLLKASIHIGGGSMASWAKKHGLSRSFVCDVLSGRRQITERLAKALGYQPARLWEKIEP